MSFDHNPGYKGTADALGMLSRLESMRAVRAALASADAKIVGRISQAENNFLLYYEQHRENKDQKQEWTDTHRRNATAAGGIVPPTNEILDAFVEFYAQFLQSCDMISFAPHGDPGVLSINKHIIQTYAGKAQCYSYGHAFEYPFESGRFGDGAEHWTKGLEGKVVLVVSPFEKSVHEQIPKLDDVYRLCPEERPKFKEVKTVKTPLTQMYIDDVPESGVNWLDEIEKLKKSIQEVGDFDVALIGCGPYTFPVALFIKEVCKKHAVMVAGVLQVMFGIGGNRFLRREGVSKMVNEAWIRPSESEKPKNYATIESGCYW